MVRKITQFTSKYFGLQIHAFHLNLKSNAWLLSTIGLVDKTLHNIFNQKDISSSPS